MKKADPVQYIQKMITGFKLPEKDPLAGCLLAIPRDNPVWDSAIFVSTSQGKNGYADIFQFWVRSFFSFVEDTQMGPLFHEMVPFVVCRKIPADEFNRAYLGLLHQRIPDEAFTERQAYPQTYVELEKRPFGDAFIILDHPKLQSAVAYSDQQFVSYFVVVHPGNL